MKIIFDSEKEKADFAAFFENNMHLGLLDFFIYIAPSLPPAKRYDFLLKNSTSIGRDFSNKSVEFNCALFNIIIDTLLNITTGGYTKNYLPYEFKKSIINFRDYLKNNKDDLLLTDDSKLFLNNKSFIFDDLIKCKELLFFLVDESLFSSLINIKTSEFTYHTAFIKRLFNYILHDHNQSFIEYCLSSIYELAINNDRSDLKTLYNHFYLSIRQYSSLVENNKDLFFINEASKQEIKHYFDFISNGTLDSFIHFDFKKLDEEHFSYFKEALLTHILSFDIVQTKYNFSLIFNLGLFDKNELFKIMLERRPSSFRPTKNGFVKLNELMNNLDLDSDLKIKINNIIDSQLLIGISDYKKIFKSILDSFENTSINLNDIDLEIEFKVV